MKTAHVDAIELLYATLACKCRWNFIISNWSVRALKSLGIKFPEWVCIRAFEMILFYELQDEDSNERGKIARWVFFSKRPPSRTRWVWLQIIVKLIRPCICILGNLRRLIKYLCESRLAGSENFNFSLFLGKLSRENWFCLFSTRFFHILPRKYHKKIISPFFNAISHFSKSCQKTKLFYHFSARFFIFSRNIAQKKFILPLFDA